MAGCFYNFKMEINSARPREIKLKKKEKEKEKREKKTPFFEKTCKPALNSGF